MLNKSKIQLIREKLELINDYRNSLVNLMDKYMVENNIFIYKNNQLHEVTEGYFEVIDTFNDIHEAVKECMNNNEMKGIHIINNSVFEVGYIKRLLSECTEDSKILDIDRFVNVR